MMYSLWKTTACLVMLRLVSATDFPISSNYTLKQTTCIKAVYNKVVFDVGEACFLCFCQNSIEACWPRDINLCGDQLRLGSQTPSPSGSLRVRRSPIGLSDIFFRDATREFFGKQIAEQCKPFQSSFSDGCPPADWCVGCTVCDCDANGRWDCHILSFCNGEERKKIKVPLPVMPTRRVYHQNKSDANKMIPKRKKVAKPRPKPQGKDQKRNNAKKPNGRRKVSNTAKKPINKPGNRAHRPNKNISRKPVVKRRNPIQKSKQPPKKPNMTKKPQKKVFRTKKPQQKRTIKQQTTTKKQTTIKPAQRILKRKVIYLTTAKPRAKSEVANLMNPKNNLEESVLGRKIIKKVMTKVHKMIGKQMEKLRNTTRVQRSVKSINKKDCKKTKKTDKKKIKLFDYNMRKNKLKNYKLPNNFRKKRQALDLDPSFIKLNNVNLIEDNPVGFEEISMNKTQNTTQVDSEGTINNTAQSLVQNSVSTNSTTEISYTTAKINLLNSSTTVNMYYKYFFPKNSSNSSKLTEFIPITNINKTSNVLNTMVTEKVKNTENRNVEKARQYALIMSDPSFHHIKNKKWQTLQIMRDNVINVNSKSKFNKTSRRFTNNPPIDGSFVKQLKNMIRNKEIKRKLGITHKHNLKRIVTNNFKTAPPSYFGSTLTSTNKSHNISSLQILLQSLMKEMNNSDQNSTVSIKRINSKFSLFKYLRSIFKNIFTRKKGKHLNSHKTNEGMTLQILCENIGACFLNKHNTNVLRSKIHDLNAETEKIFKSIKIIKGLLYLIEVPVNNDNRTKKPLNRDMQKLDAILRDNYKENSSLTKTQAAQINYVKENVHQFINSVGKFGTLLNEIIDVLYKNNKKYTCQRDVRIVHKKKKLKSLNKVKNLLVKYNIMQNTFMKKMYQLLTDVEKNMTTEHSKPKVSVKDLNNTQVIERYSKNIIENLRRLKNLAQTLNSNRRKRQTMREDDAIEYLLMLMEYLLKKNHPLDTAPVNDGIDLLIEAIQNAPDIKIIKKKVLDDLPTTSTATRTTSVDLSYFQEDSISDSNRISKEENKSTKNENILAIKQPVEHEEEITQIVYYKRFDDEEKTTKEMSKEYEITTENLKKEKLKNSENSENEKTGFDRFESALDDTRRYEVFNTDLEEEPIVPVITTTDIVPTTISKVTVKERPEESTFVPLRDYKLDDDPLPENKTKLDWIEENFGKEIREFREENVPKTTQTVTEVTQTTSKPLDQNVDNISSLTVEREEEEQKKKSKIAADEVLYRKQIEFLNSLDYGTEKSEFEESELKDDEKYSSDGFPVYFVK